MNPALIDWWRSTQEQQGPMSPAMYGNPAFGGDYAPSQQMSPAGLAGQQPLGSDEQREKNSIAPKREPAMGNAARDITQGANPIANGAQNALESTRMSLELTEDQRRRAMGDALIGFFGNFASSKNPTALGSLAESAPAGLQAWNAAEAEARAMNLASLNRQDMLENRDWDRSLKQRQYDLMKQREDRLSKQRAGLKPGNQIALTNSYSKATIDRADAYDKKVSDAFQALPEEYRTNAALEKIQREVNKQMKPYDENIRRIKNTAYALGWDVENNIPISDVNDYFETEQSSNSPFIAADGTIMDEVDEDELYNIAGG